MMYLSLYLPYLTLLKYTVPEFLVLDSLSHSLNINSPCFCEPSSYLSSTTSSALTYSNSKTNRDFLIWKYRPPNPTLTTKCGLISNKDLRKTHALFHYVPEVEAESTSYCQQCTSNTEHDVN